MSAEEMLKLINGLEEEEKQKFLDLIFEEYYAGGGAVRYN